MRNWPRNHRRAPALVSRHSLCALHDQLRDFPAVRPNGRGRGRCVQGASGHFPLQGFRSSEELRQRLSGRGLLRRRCRTLMPIVVRTELRAASRRSRAARRSFLRTGEIGGRLVSGEPQTRQIWILRALACLGVILLAVLVDTLILLPQRADHRFKQLQLGSTKARAESLLGSPRRMAEVGELSRFRDCEHSQNLSATEVLVYTVGLDRLFAVGFRDGQVVAKCSTAM
jgi:hypothetical protein